MRLGPAAECLPYDEYFEEQPSVGYETLLYHCMVGNTLLFQRDDMIEASWGRRAGGARGLESPRRLIRRPTLPTAMVRRRPTRCLPATGAAGYHLEETLGGPRARRVCVLELPERMARNDDVYAAGRFGSSLQRRFGIAF